jgi:diguanylate cyclase (GGDEF)-like protein
LSGGNYVLIVNIAMAAIVTASFLFAFLRDKTRVQAFYWLATAALVVANGAIEAAIPHLNNAPLPRAGAVGAFLAAVGFLGKGFAAHYQVRFPNRVAVLVWIGGLALFSLTLGMERNSVPRLFLHNLPYALMGMICIAVIAKARAKTILDLGAIAVVGLLVAHFLLRPLTVTLLGGMGATASEYLSTPYAAFDQTVLSVLCMVLVAIMSFLMVRDVIRSLIRSSNTDPLSGLLNRRGFLDRARDLMDQSVAAGKDVYLVIADIDHFKSVNDTHGHEAGDSVIRAFAGLLEALASSGTSVARIGGEEFAVLFTAPNPTIARLFCENIRTTAENGGADRTVVPYTASFGLARLGQVETLESLTKRADMALYTAKQTGRNRVCFDGMAPDNPESALEAA